MYTTYSLNDFLSDGRPLKYLVDLLESGQTVTFCCLNHCKLVDSTTLQVFAYGEQWTMPWQTEQSLLEHRRELLASVLLALSTLLNLSDYELQKSMLVSTLIIEKLLYQYAYRLEGSHGKALLFRLESKNMLSAHLIEPNSIQIDQSML